MRPANNPRPADPPGVPARRAALRLLDAVLRRGQPLEAALAPATRDLPLAADRALAHALAGAVLRRLADLDALIDGATRQRLPDDAKARGALRIALAQLAVLGTPPHAAIATVLPLVDGGPRKLVHGVFGTLARAGVTLPQEPRLPDAVAARWTAAWGADVAGGIARAVAHPPPLDLTLASAPVEHPAGTALAPGHVRLPAGTDVRTAAGYDAGGWWVQDLAASIPARLLGPGGGARVLDLCAAPGGKTLQLAAAGWDVTALDVSEGRAARLRENLHRTRLSARVVVADALAWAPDAPFDAVLIDAPCSATGIVRRHPEVMVRARDAVIAEMAGVQAALLARAADWVRPGGRLVYATCSLEPAEGERQAAAFLSNRADYATDAVTPGDLPAGIDPTSEGWVRTTPALLADHGGVDGFFVARLARTV